MCIASRVGIAALSVALAASAAHAQVVDVTEGPATPAAQAGRTPQTAPLDQPPFARLYVNLTRGQTITADADPDQPAPSPGSARAAASHRYAAYDVVISATSRALYSDTRDSRRADIAALNELRRMSVHMHVEGLASDKVTVVQTSRHDPGVLTLQMSPSNVRLGRAPEPGALEAVATEAAAELSHFLGPIGWLVDSFIGSRHHPAGPSFYSYQSADDEFGWNWYLTPNQTIEGIHRGSALIQTRADVAYVRVTIDLVTDWAHDGVWTKPYTFLVAIPPPGQ
jgi:hypothetical protein